MKKIAVFLFALGAGISSAFAVGDQACHDACEEAYNYCVETNPGSNGEWECSKIGLKCHRECNYAG